jgi:hypothetical protein
MGDVYRVRAACDHSDLTYFGILMLNASGVDVERLVLVVILLQEDQLGGRYITVDNFQACFVGNRPTPCSRNFVNTAHTRRLQILRSPLSQQGPALTDLSATE